jgi:hypothetical protein
MYAARCSTYPKQRRSHHLIRRSAPHVSYGLVSMLPEGPGSGYQGLGWRPRLAFEAMANLKAG